jgi:2-polyprenyl-3-methyl-5-hydroxy-6-metoxy-1,4-benzoquinol methylase
VLGGLDVVTNREALSEASIAVAPAPVRERLPFVLPEFNRHSWVDELARSAWEPRIARVSRAWLDIEWLSVAAGARECALLWISPDSLPELIPKWEVAQLSAIQLQTGNAHFGGNAATSPPSVSGMICIAIGALDKLEQLREAWTAADNETLGKLFGYPPCCRGFFRDVWTKHSCLDTTWTMAENTSLCQDHTVRIELSEETPPLANILWRWIGVRAVPHLPCRFDCPPSIALGTRLLEIGRNAGYVEEVEWIAEILTWPVEWSALHGIAEIKSPLVKISARTDATAGKWTVQWIGTKYPKEGATGLKFPYKPSKKPTLTQSRGYRRGLAHGPQDSWQYADNGFASLQTMQALHQPIVTLARATLKGESGDVLDLGCGNGMLLAKICQGRTDLIPYGVDINGSALEHARQLLPRSAGNFLQGDIFNIELWGSRSRRYALALLMLGRLLEVPREKALGMLRRLQSSCSLVLGYTYPDSSGRPLAAIAQELGIELTESSCGTAAFLKQGRAD